MKKIIKSSHFIALIIAWCVFHISVFSQTCVNCDTIRKNVSIGYLNTINTTEKQQTVIGYNNITGNNNAVAVGSMSKAIGSHSYLFGSFSESKGIHSYVIGSNSEATTLYSFAIGVGSKSLSTSAMAIGNFVEASGESSIVLGMGSYQSELVHNIPHSLAVGFGSTIPTFFVGGAPGPTSTGNVGIATTNPQAKLHVNGDFQVGDAENPREMRLHGSINSESISAYTFGDGSITGSNYSFIAGRNSIIHPGNPHGNIIGSESTINGGFHSIVVGSNSQATNDFSFVFGPYSKSKGTMSFAIGSHVEAWSGGSFIIGNGKDTTKFINTIPNSLMIGFGSVMPTLFVEKAPFSHDDDRTGRIGIGNVTDPQAKLHIRADEVEDATLLLEATGQGKESSILFGSEHYVSAAEEDHFRFNTAEGKAFVFQNGDIFMEDINFGIIMKSPNGKCWRGVMTDNGTLSFSQVICPGEAASVQNLPAEKGKLKAYPNPTTGNLIIESELFGNNTEIVVSSPEGKTMLRQMITSARTEVSLKSFAPGTYILQLLSNGQLVESRKVVKN